MQLTERCEGAVRQISFMLWWHRTRYVIAFPSAMFFHVTNKIMCVVSRPLAWIPTLYTHCTSADSPRRPSHQQVTCHVLPLQLG
jgi:hypothetical protein